jgi:predicted RNA binding protein YcfA (HicA-like mRNA interferase family)
LSPLKLLAYRDLARVAEMAGFEWKRRRGSHNTFQAKDGRVVVIPDHGSQVIVRPLLRKIIRELGLTLEEYNRFVEEL